MKVTKKRLPPYVKLRVTCNDSILFQKIVHCNHDYLHCHYHHQNLKKLKFLLMKTNNSTYCTWEALIYCAACLCLSSKTHNEYHQASLQYRCLFAESNLLLYSIFSRSLLCHHVGVLLEGNGTFSSPVAHVFCYWLTYLEAIYSSSQSSFASNIQDEG